MRYLHLPSVAGFKCDGQMVLKNIHPIYNLVEIRNITCIYGIKNYKVVHYYISQQMVPYKCYHRQPHLWYPVPLVEKVIYSTTANSMKLRHRSFSATSLTVYAVPCNTFYCPIKPFLKSTSMIGEILTDFSLLSK